MNNETRSHASTRRGLITSRLPETQLLGLSGSPLSTESSKLIIPGREGSRPLPMTREGAHVTMLAAALLFGIAPNIILGHSAEASGVKAQWDSTLNSFYPGDAERAAKVLKMRRITDALNGPHFYDTASRIIAREYYGNTDAVYDNEGFLVRFQDKKLAQAKAKGTFDSFRVGFGFCHSRSAWALRDEFPFRQPGSIVEEFPDIIMPSLREMVEFQMMKYLASAVAYYRENAAENKQVFMDRLLKEPNNPAAAFNGDFPIGDVGAWLAHVAKVERRRDGLYLLASRASDNYTWLHESQMKDAMYTLDFGDRNNPPQAPEGMKMIMYGLEYASPYFYAPFADFLYYGTPLPPKELVKFPPFFPDWTVS